MDKKPTMPEIEKKWERVCAINEIGDPGSYGFRHYAGQYPLYGFVVLKNGEICGYRNICPHQGRPLDWAPHRFLTKDKTQIMCAAHGAIFELMTGLCIAGPCLGRSLKPWPVKIDGDDVYAEVLPEPLIR